MSLVNVRVKNIRPKYSNLKEWCQDPDNVYIGRGRIVFIDGVRYPPTDSIFANPFKLKDCVSIDECLTKYEIHLRRLLKSARIRSQFLQLKDKNLGCWCTPDRCHGDVILRLLEELV